MSKIHIPIGSTQPALTKQRNVAFDLDTLLVTRLLITANSGAGKSYLLRKLMEELFGHVQVICIDPEGEFATLREKYGFVLVGPGGETPADIRSAEMVAHKLLELRASAVCDLYEMKPVSNRHEWVRRFLDALVDAPKKLWHPLIVIVDEAHQFAPEAKAGKSVAHDAMSGLATKGRKRGFCAIFATQRLAKLDKDVSSELLNRLVGGTFEDVDVKRALDLLSVASEDQRDFKLKLRTMEPGWFYAFGRAVSKERLLFKVGSVVTSHPQPGSSKHAAGPPPAPDKVKALLPKLAELPQQAEEKAKTVEELRRRVREQEVEIRRLTHTGPKTITASSSAAPVVDTRKLEKAIRAQLVAEISEPYTAIVKSLPMTRKRIGEELDRDFSAITRELKQVMDKLGKSVNSKMAAPLVNAAVRETFVTSTTSAVSTLTASKSAAATKPKLTPTPVSSNGTSTNGTLTGPEQRILDAIAWLNSIGVEDPKQPAVAFLAGYSYGGGGYNNPRGALSSKGLLRYLPGNRIQLTPAGRELANVPDEVLTTEELHRKVLAQLPGPEARILGVLLAHPEGMSNEELAQAARYTYGSGGYNNPRSRLRTLGLVDYVDNKVVPEKLLYLD